MTDEIRHAAGFVLFRDEAGKPRFLLLKNARHGTWGFPKGHRDPGEDDLACARRELEEETGLDAIAIVPGFDRLERYPLPKSGALKSVRYFLARLIEGEPELSREHSEGGFKSAEEALALLQHESARTLLRAAAEHLAGDSDR